MSLYPVVVDGKAEGFVSFMQDTISWEERTLRIYTAEVSDGKSKAECYFYSDGSDAEARVPHIIHAFTENAELYPPTTSHPLVGLPLAYLHRMLPVGRLERFEAHLGCVKDTETGLITLTTDEGEATMLLNYGAAHPQDYEWREQ